MTRAYWRPGGLAALVVAAAIGLAACSSSSSPQVASLGPSGGNPASGGNSTSPAAPTGGPTQLLDEWTSCMRSHGDPGQTAPTIDANRVIHITYPSGFTIQGQEGSNSKKNSPCNVYLSAASSALRGGPPPSTPNQALLNKYSACMRANGVPSFPDITVNSSGEVHLGLTPSMNANSPTFQNANTLCAKQTGFRGIGGTATTEPGEIIASNAGPGANG